MFGYMAQTLALNNYDSNESAKSSWLQEHHKSMQTAKQSALRNIKKVQNRVLSEQEEKNCPSQRVNWSYCGIIIKVIIKSRNIFKDQEFVMVKQLLEPKVYQIKPVNGIGLEQVINHWQLQDLQNPIIIVITPVMQKWAMYPPTTLKLC